MINRNKYSNTYFKEEQRFQQLWLWAIIILSSLLPWVMMIIQLFLGKKIGNNPAPDWLVILIWVIFGIGFPIFFYSIKLSTQVKEDGIYLRFFPFHLKYINYRYDEIESFVVREYRPIREYGGWGIRYGLGGKAYNVYGNKGIQLVFTNKKKLLIGSQKVDAFYQAITKARVNK